MIEKQSFGDRVSATVDRKRGDAERLVCIGRYKVECIGPDGKLKWSRETDNLVVNEGLNHVLDVELSAATQVATWYFALISATLTPAATHTYATPTWTEFTSYDEATRVAATFGAPAAQSVSTSSPSSFSINGTGTIAGVGLVSNNTKGDTVAAGAVLFSEGNFSEGDTGVANGDTLNVSYTASATSS